MKTKLALLSAVILAGIGTTVAIAGRDVLTPVADKAPGMSHCSMGQMNHSPSMDMSCHAGGQPTKVTAAAQPKGCCK